jgi:hypothetical protein
VLEGERFHFVHEGNFFCVDVAPVMVEDGGRWTCMAESTGGRTSCFSNLNVLGELLTFTTAHSPLLLKNVTASFSEHSKLILVPEYGFLDYFDSFFSIDTGKHSGGILKYATKCEYKLSSHSTLCNLRN